ncbi:MAG TPA: exosortase/archaeosortase family protein [Bryobacteraceae bacterium]|nr:exosortase/archaeosortase family protein [Bryobacteraceae bacterium]
MVPALTALALLLCYASTLRGMFDQWSTDEDMSHGFVVPFVVLWIVWRERGRWSKLTPCPTAWGVVALAAGAAMAIVGAMGGGLFAGSVAFLVSAAGAVLCLGGFPFLRIWAFPFLLSIFMLPKLAIVYNQATLPLQLLASRMAAAMLTAGGVGVIQQGNILNVGGHSIAVAEACNGIRYLLSLGFTAVVFAYLADSKPWMRVALLAGVVPIAIIANALRVAASAYVPALDSGTPHAVAGWMIFVFCLTILASLRWCINSIYGRYHA